MLSDSGKRVIGNVRLRRLTSLLFAALMSVNEVAMTGRKDQSSEERPEVSTI